MTHDGGIISEKPQLHRLFEQTVLSSYRCVYDRFLAGKVILDSMFLSKEIQAKVRGHV